MVLPSLSEYAATFDRAVPAILNIAVRSVMVMGLAGIAALVMRQASAAARHRVWLLAFAGVLASADPVGDVARLAHPAAPGYEPARFQPFRGRDCSAVVQLRFRRRT